MCKRSRLRSDPTSFEPTQNHLFRTKSARQKPRSPSGEMLQLNFVESYPCTIPSRKSHGMISLQKNTGGGVCTSTFTLSFPPLTIDCNSAHLTPVECALTKMPPGGQVPRTFRARKSWESGAFVRLQSHQELRGVRKVRGWGNSSARKIPSFSTKGGQQPNDEPLRASRVNNIGAV